MTARSVILGSIVALLTAAVCFAFVLYHPRGKVAETQFALLLGAVAAGATATFGWTSSSPPSRRGQQMWPTALVCVALGLIALAKAIPSVMAAEAVEEIHASVPRQCEQMLLNFPAQPASGDYRRLEWTIHETVDILLTIPEYLNERGLDREEFRSLVDRRLNFSVGHLFAAMNVRKSSGLDPEQRERISQRLREATHQLVAAAQSSNLPALESWAVEIQRAVALLFADGNLQ